MNTLTFIACLAAHPTTCQERSVLLTDQMTPMGCLMNAQPEMAKWKNAHPKWRIASFRCGRISKEVKA